MTSPNSCLLHLPVGTHLYTRQGDWQKTIEIFPCAQDVFVLKTNSWLRCVFEVCYNSYDIFTVCYHVLADGNSLHRKVQRGKPFTVKKEEGQYLWEERRYYGQPKIILTVQPEFTRLKINYRVLSAMGTIGWTGMQE